MTNNFVNLDSLRAESRKVQFLGKEFEIGYIPSGLAIPLIENHNANLESQKEYMEDKERLLSDNIRSGSLFCSFYEPEFTQEYLRANATLSQIEQMYSQLVYAILTNFTEYAAKDGGTDSGTTEKKTTGRSS